MKNIFIFLYPQNEIFEHEIENGSYVVREEWERERAKLFKLSLEDVRTDRERRDIQREAREDLANFFKPIYRKALNECIDIRYRQNGFEIVYALLDGEPRSQIITPYPQDRIIDVGMDARTHGTRKPDGTYPYPDQNYILNQLGTLNHLRIGGFHIWDCVEKLAKRAHERGINVLVDEDLTQLFASRVYEKSFDPCRFPGHNPRTDGEEFFKAFMECRRGVPWLWQDYPEIKSAKGGEK